MKQYWYGVLVALFVLGTIVLINLCFQGLNIANDITVLGGILGLIFIIGAWVVIIKHIVHYFKGKEKNNEETSNATSTTDTR
jgi:hypothetical protein